MCSGTLEREALVFEGKDFRSCGDNGGVFEMNQNFVSREQDGRREPQRDYDRTCMRHWFPGGRRHAEKRKLLPRLEAAIEFHFAILMAFLVTLAAISTIFPGISWPGFSLDISRMKFPDDPFEKM